MEERAAAPSMVSRSWYHARMRTDKEAHGWDPGAGRAGWGLALAVAICALYVLVLAGPVHRHVVGAFSDFYRFYAPDADRIAAGAFPENTYNPPGYPAALALASLVASDHFTAGKWMSLLAGGLCGVLAFVLHRRLFGEGPALLAVLILLSSPTFTTYAMSPMTDVPFVALGLAAMLAIAGEHPCGWRRTILGGLLSGGASLVRYNGAFLLVPGLVSALWRTGGFGLRAVSAGIYLGGFLLVAGTWAVLSQAHYGVAFRSTNYVDVARALGLQGNFQSLADVILADPPRFAVNYVRNVGDIFVHTLGASLALFPVGPLAVIGIGLSLAHRRRRPVVILLSAALSFLLFMSMTHWERRYHLFLLACYAGFAGFAIVELARGAGQLMRARDARRLSRASGTTWLRPFSGGAGSMGASLAAGLVVAALALVIAVPSIARSARAVRTTLERQPVELLPAARYLARATSKGATVMAMRAQIAQLSGREWQELPSADSLDELHGALRARPPDYLVYDRWMRRLRQGLVALATPDGTVSWLEPVYRDPTGDVVIYAVRLPRS